MNRTGLLLVAAFATAAVLVPTGAAPFDMTGTDSVSDDIMLQPADGPNGDYAVLNEDDELELLLTDSNPAIEGEGISSNAVTPIPRVFTITYTGDRSATVWVTDDATDVRFFGGSDSGDSIESRANSVVLGPSQTVSVGVCVDTRGEHDVEQAETFTVNAEVAEGDDGKEDRDSEVDVNRGGGPDTPTPAPTPASTDQPTETGTSSGPSGTPDESDVGSQPETATQPPTESTDSSTATANESEDDGLVEPGGLGLGPLLGIGAVLVVLLSALVGYRLYA